MRKSSLWLGIILLLTLAGCGYTTRSNISLKYTTVYITPFTNKIDITQETSIGSRYKIYRPLLETDVTRAVNTRFLLDGNLKPIRKESADLILKGELVEFNRDAVRYSDDDEVEEYRINVRVNLSLWDTKENKLVWEEKNFTGTASYFTSFYAVSAERKTEGAAVNEAITDLARRIVERTVEEW
ncbi:MAG: LPS assembly lipoprotein LptE [Candidatus Omnitrophota bacterium]|jgi:hypothetical protein